MIPVSKQRVIAKNPYKVLDAPALQDDYYLNLVDWASTNDLVVGLQSCIYIWSASSSKVTKLYDLGQNDTTTSVSWARTGPHLAVGTDTGLVQVWDVAAEKLVRVYHGHEGRVGALAWTNSLLSSGSKDRIILNRDLRDKTDFVSRLAGHKQEVCGLKWSLDEQ
jgi:cell division cycle 20-like protein 1 (cofactor of APC complex)